MNAYCYGNTKEVCITNTPSQLFFIELGGTFDSYILRK